MVAGTPDYFRTVRQTYGAAKFEGATKTVTANIETKIIEVTGKGIIYGGGLWLGHTASQKNSVAAILVDGVTIGTSSFDDLNKYNQVGKHDMPTVLRMFDEVNYVYCVSLANGITFELLFQVVYDENHGDTPDVTSSVFYSLM